MVNAVVETVGHDTSNLDRRRPRTDRGATQQLYESPVPHTGRHGGINVRQTLKVVQDGASVCRAAKTVVRLRLQTQAMSNLTTRAIEAAPAAAAVHADRGLTTKVRRGQIAPKGGNLRMLAVRPGGDERIVVLFEDRIRSRVHGNLPTFGNAKYGLRLGGHGDRKISIGPPDVGCWHRCAV